MKDVIQWSIIGIVIVIVLSIVVWLFSIAWEFFLGVALIVSFVLACNWYFGKKYGNY